jgi:hypothetical protein
MAREGPEPESHSTGCPVKKFSSVPVRTEKVEERSYRDAVLYFRE